MKYPIQYSLAKSAQKHWLLRSQHDMSYKSLTVFIVGGVYGKTDDQFNANYVIITFEKINPTV